MTDSGGGEGARSEQWRGPSEIGEDQTPGPPPLPGHDGPGQGLPEVVPAPQPASLPAYGGTPAPPPARQEKSGPFIALIGDVVRTGSWPAARRSTALSAIGDVRLDLREVLRPGETLEVEAWSLIGDVQVVVPPGTEVSVEGGAVIGSVRQTSDVDAATPRTGARLVVKGYLLIGDIKVREAGPDVGKPPRGWRWTQRGR